MSTNGPLANHSGQRGALRWLLVVSAAIAISICWPSAGAAAGPEHAIVMKETRTVTGVYKFTVHLPEATAQDWVVFCMQAPELPGQKRPSTRLTPLGEPCTDLTLRQRPMLRARITGDKSLEHLLGGEIEWKATLFSRKLVHREPGETYPPAEKPSKLERQCSLAESDTLDFSKPEFKRWVKEKELRKKASESEIDFGRRVFSLVAHDYSYEYVHNGQRSASFLCSHNKTDCQGMCNVFVSAMRANKIPARTRMGRWAKSAVEGAKLGDAANLQQHVKAEFYAKGVGWIPVDLSSAVFEPNDPLKFFGNDPGDFLTFHVDPDVTFDTVLFDPKTNRSMQGFSYEWRGEGKPVGVTIDEQWHVD